MILLQERISVFNKPNINEDELMKLQRKKASFNSKCAKFEKVEGKEPLAKKDSLAKQKAKMFEDFENFAVNEKEAKERKEEFERKKELFKNENQETEVEESMKKKKSVSEQQNNIREEIDQIADRCKENLIEKQAVFCK